MHMFQEEKSAVGMKGNFLAAKMAFLMLLLKTSVDFEVE